MDLTNEDQELGEHATTFLKFIKDLFIEFSDSITDVFLSKGNAVVLKSDWEGGDEISNFPAKWRNSEIPPSFTLQGKKFIKLHESPFNIVYRSIKSQSALIGIKFNFESAKLHAFAIIKQADFWQEFITALKDAFLSIIDLGQKMPAINIMDSNNIEIAVNFVENKQSIKKFIDSMGVLEFKCNYTDRGDFIKINFNYEKRKKVVYPDSVYEKYAKFP